MQEVQVLSVQILNLSADFVQWEERGLKAGVGSLFLVSLDKKSVITFKHFVIQVV